MPARAWKKLATDGGRSLAAMVRAAIRKLERAHPGPLQGVYLLLGDENGAAVTAIATDAFGPASPGRYEAYLRGKSRWRTTPQAFWSLRSRDPRAAVRTRLVVPPVAADTHNNCGDVLNFSRLALAVQAPFWQKVAAEAARLARANVRIKVWTHGRDVPWLHARIRVTQLKHASAS